MKIETLSLGLKIIIDTIFSYFTYKTYINVMQI